LENRHHNDIFMNAANDSEALTVDIPAIHPVCASGSLINAGFRGATAGLDIRLRHRSLYHSASRMNC
jgi:hypothetical protein